MCRAARYSLAAVCVPVVSRCSCLITDRNSCGISCGGRTDKGVSGVGQVVALRVRSNMSEGDGVIPAPAANGAADEQAAAEQATTQSHTVGERRELDYCKMLNSCLPSDVRVLAWRPTDAEFSARFSATGRTYKYFFQLRDLDVAKMREAASRLVGEHDLRNFCKIDPSVNSFVRSILSFDVEPVEQFAGGLSRESPEAVWAFTVHGTAFLYHQVRCMVAVLFLVGEGKEAPEIISTLLDIERTPRRPNYDMASDAPLLLYRIHYNETGTEWVTEPNASAAIANLWAEQQRGLMLRSAMLHAMRDTLPETSTRVAHTSGKGHVPLTQRPTHESVETRTKGRAK